MEHAERGHKREIYIPQWILQILKSNNDPQNCTLSVTLSTHNGLFAWLWRLATIKIMHPTKGGEQTFEKKCVCSHQSIEKEAQAIKNLQNCKCDTLCHFADRALEAENAQFPSENQNFDGRLKRKDTNRMGRRTISVKRWPNETLFKAFKAP